MKTFAIMKKLVLFVAVGLLMISCLEEDNWLEDNIEPTGDHYPTIADFDVRNPDPQGEYQVGETINLDLLFWSEDEVSEIVLRDSVVNESGQQEYSRYSYSEATYFEETQTDSLGMEYTIPSVPNDPSVIHLQVEVINENGLSRTNDESGNIGAQDLTITVNQ